MSNHCDNPQCPKWHGEDKTSIHHLNILNVPNGYVAYEIRRVTGVTLCLACSGAIELLKECWQKADEVPAGKSKPPETVSNPS